MEVDILELDALLERSKRGRCGRLLDGILGTENLVYTLPAAHADGDVVECLGEVLDRVEDIVEHHQVVDEGGSLHARHAVEDDVTSCPHHDDDDAGAHKLAGGMCGTLTYGHAHHCIAVGVVDMGKAVLHLALGEESLDDTQSAQGLIELC